MCFCLFPWNNEVNISLFCWHFYLQFHIMANQLHCIYWNIDERLIGSHSRQRWTGTLCYHLRPASWIFNLPDKLFRKCHSSSHWEPKVGRKMKSASLTTHLTLITLYFGQMDHSRGCIGVNYFSVILESLSKVCIWKFPGQGSNRSLSCSHRNSITGFESCLPLKPQLTALPDP